MICCIQANEISIFFLNWCILIKIVLPYKVQSLFSHSEISRRNKMKRTHYANTTKMTAEAASDLFLIIFFLIVQETCIQFNFINWWIFSWIWEHFINISHWIVCFYKDCPITGTCCKRNLISTRAWAIEKLLREIEITLLSLWQFSFNLVTAGFTIL